MTERQTCFLKLKLTMNNPLISVIVPCFNQAHYLDECLQSVYNQTYSNWECIIVNDGSPDNTNEVAKFWVDKDSRFKYVFKENGGLSSARNSGLELAQGEWVQFLDCDDRIHVEKFEKSSCFFLEYDLIISDFYYFDKNGEFDHSYDYKLKKIDFELVVLGWDLDFTIPIHSGLFRKKNIQVFDISLKAKEDWLFWLLFLKSSSRNIILPQKYAYYRMHATSMTRNRQLMFSNEVSAYKKIFPLLDDDMKVEFFISRINHKNQEIVFIANELDDVYNSKAQRFLFRLHKVKDRVKNYFKKSR